MAASFRPSGSFDIVGRSKSGHGDFQTRPLGVEPGHEFRIPAIGLFPIYAKAGGLFSYGPNNFELFRQAGGIVGKILRGTNRPNFPSSDPFTCRS
jgi:hypothetical protein